MTNSFAEKNWKRYYITLAVWLAVQIGVYYILTITLS